MARRHPHGFTVIEVMLVAVITSLLATLGIAKLVEPRKTAWDADAKNSVNISLKQAHLYRVKNGTFTGFVAQLPHDEPGLDIVQPGEPAPEAGPDVNPKRVWLTVTADGDQLGSCAASKSGRVWCAERIDRSASQSWYGVGPSGSAPEVYADPDTPWKEDEWPGPNGEGGTPRTDRPDPTTTTPDPTTTTPDPPLPPDTDGDGTPDEQDSCPSEPGAQSDGCPATETTPTSGPDPDPDPGPDVPPKDTDDDGTPDEQDRCPEQAGNQADGCPKQDEQPEPEPPTEDEKDSAQDAADTGKEEYLDNLVKDPNYWLRCTRTGDGQPINQLWSGHLDDPRTWKQLPDGSSYTVELVPAPGQSACVPGNPASMEDPGGTITIEVTGKDGPATETIRVTFRRQKFLDFLYFTDFETSDPYMYALNAAGAQTSPDLVTWAQQNCNKYSRQGRQPAKYNGLINRNGRWQNFTQTCSQIQFSPLDVIGGSMHTNDTFVVCGSPTFGGAKTDKIDASGGWQGSSSCTNNRPNMVGTFNGAAGNVSVPPSNQQLSDKALDGYRFSGKTTIKLDGSAMTVNGRTMPLPANGVIYVQHAATCAARYNPLDPYSTPDHCAQAFVHGTFNRDLTIASAGDIIVTDDLRSGQDAVGGLIANGLVRVYHPVRRSASDPLQCTNSGGPGNITIETAILTLNHSFTVDNYYCGGPLGTLTVKGGIAQRYRGPVGQANGSQVSSGYVKSYQYDARLKYRTPPLFLDPLASDWAVLRVEDVPVRQ